MRTGLMIIIIFVLASIGEELEAIHEILNKIFEVLK